LIVEGKTGYTCAQYINYEERIMELCSKPHQIELMRDYCREHIAHFTPEHCADGFLNLYRSANSSNGNFHLNHENLTYHS